jgi:hypothetical protein
VSDQPLDLEPFKRRIQQLKLDGMSHIAAARDEELVGTDWKHDDGPDIECVHCDDIFGECNALRDLVAEVERLAAQLAATHAAIRALRDNWNHYADGIIATTQRHSAERRVIDSAVSVSVLV